MERIILKVNGGPDIAFNGECVAHAHDQPTDVSSTIYETEKGHWLLAATNNHDVLVKHKVIENKSVEDLTEILGYTAVAKSLYAQLGIDTTNNLDI
ncbi:hypothetical protein RA241_000774 [Cronobacter sakazakii]|uniref:hypothetical protein n=1 Tax=Cronobacter TaxID=413496 RepID=UPI000D017ED8|nr:hypothetical protein [Cronobacter turicensis]EKC7002261.1 hypothetical protein [Cronobacter sakazakii]EKM5753110.1 hypothetical protein [Cronobacter sakazakii]EKY1951544.1 hypothetical protein [Cronobacter sakazakii]EKY1956808.1 hypothetical protein [Cronobacter sakazakii]EKY1959477.1 hypothetical protein [Cronobacter sakazakii]